MDQESGRVISLVEAESALRVQLARHEARRFDVDTARVLRWRVEDMVELVTELSRDEDFWSRLESAGERPLTSEQIDAVHEFDGVALADLLRLAGYVSPPSPDVEYLVKVTVVALEDSLRDVPRQSSAVRQAQNDLILFCKRVRSQITPLGLPDEDAGVLRVSARRVGRTARWLLPPAIGVAGGALVEGVLPGTGFGLAAGKALATVAETLGQRGADLVLGHDATAIEIAHDLEVGWSSFDPITTHLAAADDLIATGSHVLRTADDHVREQVAELMQEARRHLRRVDDVCRGTGVRLDGHQEHALENAKDALAGLEVDLEMFVEGTAVEAADHARRMRAQRKAKEHALGTEPPSTGMGL